jgi:predicted regulator of amino acid metabolism with ACT domain
MEKEGYRATLAMLTERYPDRVAISVDEAAAAIGVNRKTVYAAIKRRYNPMPSQKVTPSRVVIPIPALAKWLC